MRCVNHNIVSEKREETHSEYSLYAFNPDADSHTQKVSTNLFNLLETIIFDRTMKKDYTPTHTPERPYHRRVRRKCEN